MNFDFGYQLDLNWPMTSLTALLEVVSLRWIPVTMSHAAMSHESRRYDDLEGVKPMAKRSNVYGLSSYYYYFWQRNYYLRNFRNRDHHRAAGLYLKMCLFDRTLNRLVLKLNPKLGQGYPNLFERWRNLNLGFWRIQNILIGVQINKLLCEKNLKLLFLWNRSMRVENCFMDKWGHFGLN